MLKHLISLVFLLLCFSYIPALSDTNLKILPKIKPKVLINKIEKETNTLIPQKKPNIKIKKI